MDHPAFDYRVLGSDIDTDCIRKSESGIYEMGSIIDIPTIYQKKYFEVIGDKSNQQIKIGGRLRTRVKFRLHNLIDYHEKIPLTFNVIFLRNVLYYFPKGIAAKIIYKLVSHLEIGGLLFIGLTEKLQDLHPNLAPVAASVYQKRVR